MLRSRVRLLIATLWAGSLWTIGYLVAPVLFTQLNDRVLAGTIAGQMFRFEAWLSVGCALVLLAVSNSLRSGSRSRRINWLIMGMLACTLIGYFALHPWMAALREAAGPGGIATSPDRAVFGMLHGVSSFFYLVQSVLAAILMIRVGGDQPRDD